jgi:hypothetical protein
VTQRWETFERGGAYGPPKRFFSLTAVGSRQLQQEHEQMLEEKLNQADCGYSWCRSVGEVRRMVGHWPQHRRVGIPSSPTGEGTPPATTGHLALFAKWPSTMGWIVVHGAERRERGIVVSLTVGGHQSHDRYQKKAE